jgi:hypothetical protein
LLVGYFQSPKYFEKYKESICKLIKLDVKKLIIKNKVGLDFENDTIISMHFRLGDYKKYPDKHPILTEKYYSNCLTYFNNQLTSNYNVLYFCEEVDLKEVNYTINNLKKKFPLKKFVRADPMLKDWEQMLLMSICNHNIIANSTFSWWGAYLNSNLEKIVCYPEEWFCLETKKDTSDLFLEDWIKISLK